MNDQFKILNKEFSTEYLSTVINRLQYYKELGEKTFDQLREEDMHYQPNGESNSMSVIIQHMAGNMISRFTNFLEEDGEKDWRNRDGEFVDRELSKQELIAEWNKGWDCFMSALHSLSAEDLLHTVYIRKEPLTVIDAINRQLAHHSYHVGQIVYLGRMIRNEDWINLSIPKGKSEEFNRGTGPKDWDKK